MNSQKKIEVNQSSLLSLRAELLRKKQEVHDAKLSEFPNRPTVVTKPIAKLDKANEGVEARSRRDFEDEEEERNTLRKSQSILEAKSKLYDELSKNPEMGEGSAHFLVNFKGKEQMDKKDTDVEEEEESDKIESDYEDDEEWVDFVDCLGRTKRCHRDDLESMKANDENLRKSLFGSREQEQEKESKEPEVKDLPEIAGEPELCSEDMRREMLRRKWEEEERKLLDRKDIHYQHVLFDEARSHGVGYYSFSTDETERARQLEELKNLRRETERQQAATQEAAMKKKKQMAERLRAARRRKRERLGLPPEEEVEEPIEEEEKPEKPEELKREEQHTTTIRPWDIGKDNTSRILTQEEWIQRKREERPEEFAPPRITPTGQRKKRKPEPMERTPPEAYVRDVKDSKPPPRRISPVREDSPVRRGFGAEVPPPPNLESYGSSAPKTSKPSSDIEKSIEEGLNFIRKQVEKKQSQQSKGFIEFL